MNTIVDHVRLERTTSPFTLSACKALRLTIGVALFLLTSLCSAQNLVNNPGFESYTTPPNNYG